MYMGLYSTELLNIWSPSTQAKLLPYLQVAYSTKITNSVCLTYKLLIFLSHKL